MTDSSCQSAVERARKQFEQARARLQAVEARERQAERKRDTRRKIILGAALVELADRDPSAAAMIRKLISGLPRDRDRQTFDGWEAPKPQPGLPNQDGGSA